MSAGLVNMSLYNFFICGPKFTYFFRPTWKGLWLRKYFSYLQYVDAFRRYSRSKSKVVRKSSKFWTFFSPSQILGGRPSKSYTHFITPASRHVVWKNFCEDTPTTLEVVGAHTLNFRPNFKFSRLNFFLFFFKGRPLPVVVCASKCWSIWKVCKNLRGQHPQRPKCSLPKNVRLGGSIWAPITLLFVDQSSPNFRYPTWKKL